MQQDLGFFNPQESDHHLEEEDDDVVAAVDLVESTELEEPIINSLNQLLRQKKLDSVEILKTLKANPSGLLTLEHRNVEEVFQSLI